MAKNRKDNQALKPFALGALVIGMLWGTSLFPELKINGFSPKKINILSDITRANNQPLIPDDNQIYLDSLQAVRDSLENEYKLRMLASKMDSLREIKKDSIRKMAMLRIDSLKNNTIAFEDFSIGQDALEQFYKTLHGRSKIGRPVRIAFLGDSFIEGDIMVCDIRESLQNKFGGHGVGFVPMASIVAAYTPTIKHGFKDWTTYSIINNKYKDYPFTLTGVAFKPEIGAYANFEGVKWRANLDTVSCARVLYRNSKNVSIDMVVNNKDSMRYELPDQSQISQLIVKGEIGNLKMKVVGSDDVEILGVVLEDNAGVTVDNYSIRGNSGILMHRVDITQTKELQKLMSYDLVVLQYGVNAVERDVLSYSGYRKQMVSVINKLKQALPNTSFLLLSVPDRSTLVEGEFVTMNGIPAMIKAQKEIAQECGVAFWNMYEAMGGYNSMVGFVAKNWGSKDYTHISHAGGRYIASAFVKALLLDKEKYDALISIDKEVAYE
ncbi:MAG: hypothetical protein ACRCXV_08970 [Bacteroidales bacterium]